MNLVLKIKKVNSIILIRLLICIVAFSGMLIGPVSRQFLGSTNRYLRPWRMYSGYGRDICDIEYYLKENNKDFVKLDPYEYIKSEDWLDTPRKIKNIRNPKEVKLNAKKMCELIPEGQFLYVKAKCGQLRKGWKLIINNRSRPFCATKKIDFKDILPK